MASHNHDASPQGGADIQDLIAEFGALVEESLIGMVFEEQGFHEARKALAQIAQNVPAEEASGFDFSGLAGNEFEVLREGSETTTPVKSRSSPSTAVSQVSRSTPASEVQEDFQVDLKEPLARENFAESTLKEAFPLLKEFDIRYALEQTGGNVEQASDILLNYSHLEETGQRQRGIDAFCSLEDTPKRLVKGKKKSSGLAVNPDGTPKKAGRRILPVDYRPALPKLDADENDGGPSKKKTTLSAASAGDYTEKVEAAKQLREVAQGSFASATSAIRRGRSDPYFFQVASVYSERAREQTNRARLAESIAAEALVDEQSTGDTLDLHYVPVHDGVRIALERTQKWWAQLGENRSKKARDIPLRIITGVGLHSSGGYSRMYGPVGAALEREGWKVQSRQGHYLITGKK